GPPPSWSTHCNSDRPPVAPGPTSSRVWTPRTEPRPSARPDVGERRADGGVPGRASNARRSAVTSGDLDIYLDEATHLLQLDPDQVRAVRSGLGLGAPL